MECGLHFSRRANAARSLSEDRAVTTERRRPERADNVHIEREVQGPHPAFADRREGGEALARFVAPEPDADAVVLGLPRGGIPVGAALARARGCALDTLVVRKLPIPASPEMGFGAATLGGGVQLNDRVVRAFGIGSDQVQAVLDDVRRELRRRARAYRGTDDPPAVEGRHVYLVDDGLATGYTALAGVDALGNLGPASVTVCAPVSPIDSIAWVAPHVDAVYVLLAQTAGSFAVASFYRDFHEMTDDEVRALLQKEATPPG